MSATPFSFLPILWLAYRFGEESRDRADFASIRGITEEDVETTRTLAWIGPPLERIGTGTPSRPTGRRPLRVRRPKQPFP